MTQKHDFQNKKHIVHVSLSKKVLHVGIDPSFWANLLFGERPPRGQLYRIRVEQHPTTHVPDYYRRSSKKEYNRWALDPATLKEFAPLQRHRHERIEALRRPGCVIRWAHHIVRAVSRSPSNNDLCQRC